MYPELELLARYSHTGTQDAKTVWSPPPIETNSPNLPQGQLNGNQVGAAAFAVIYSPVDGTTFQDLDRMQFVLDGQPYPYVWYAGKKDENTAPDPAKVRYGTIIWLGDPPYSQENGPADPLRNTAPKFIDNISINAWAGATAITADYTVDIYGWRYNSVTLAGRMPQYGGQQIEVPDLVSGKTFNVIVPTVDAAGDWRGAWTSLPGGPQQGNGHGTPIHKFVRRARNSNATTVNEIYIPQYQNSSSSPAVARAEDNLYFKLNARQALLIEAWGVNGPLAPNSGGYDLNAAWIATPGEQNHQRHPRGGRPAGYQLGTTRFGLIRGATDRYAGVPQLDSPVLLTEETGYLTFVDNGTSVPKNNVSMTMVATLLGSSGQGGV